MDNKRYIVHDFLSGNPIFIDRKEKTVSFYDSNIYGQIFNLKNPEHHVYDIKKINGFIRRTNNPNYGLKTSKAVDGFIYAYLLTPEQQAMCGRTPTIFGWNKLIVATDNFTEAIKTMCEKVYEDKYCGNLGDKEAERGKLLNYCAMYLRNYRKNPPPDKKPSVINDLQEKVTEVKNAPVPDKATKIKTDKELNG